MVPIQFTTSKTPKTHFFRTFHITLLKVLIQDQYWMIHPSKNDSSRDEFTRFWMIHPGEDDNARDISLDLDFG